MSMCDHSGSLRELDAAVQKFVAATSPVPGTKVLAHWVMVTGEEIVEGEHTGHAVGVTSKPYQAEYTTVGLLSMGASMVAAGPSRNTAVYDGED